MKPSELFYKCAFEVKYETVGNDVNYAFIEDGSTLYLFLQGSSSDVDWRRNFTFPARPYKDMGIPYLVHRGFLEAWKELEDVVIAKVTERVPYGEWKYKYDHVVVIGYSHGSSLAFFATECIWYHREDLRDGGFETYAFESPRVFAGFWIPKKLRERWNNMTVFVNGSDIVTHCPPRIFGFCHAGHIVHIKGDVSLVEGRLPKCIKYHYPQVVEDGLKKYEKDKDC